MKLRYIAIDLDDKAFNRNYCSEFGFRTRFISNFLSKQIRKRNFETDGTFKMICVNANPIKPKECVIVPIDVLESEVSFDQEKYEQIKGTTDCEYYLEMFEKGFRKASKFKEIPLQTLLNLIREFRENGCKNEWLHKKKRFKELDIEVITKCYFTTLDFKLVATINKISTKEELWSGVLLRTEPDEIFFDKEFKDILIDNENITITDFLDRPRFAIDLDKALASEFNFERLSNEFVDVE